MTFRQGITLFLDRGASRVPLSPKGGNKNFYKGTKTGPMGKFAAGKTKYSIDPSKVRQFVVPDLTGFKVRPQICVLFLKQRRKFSILYRLQEGCKWINSNPFFYSQCWVL
jgi:large subunit ribosomal protein L41